MGRLYPYSMHADIIDVIVSSVFDIEMQILNSTFRHDRAAMARMAAMQIRAEQGESRMEIAERYNRSVRMVDHYLRRVAELKRYDAWFKGKYAESLSLLHRNRVPYSSDRIQVGTTVWMRTDSRNRSYEGIVTHIDDSIFTVESFLNPNYCTVHNLDSGRISRDYETSLDIVEVQA